MLIFTGTDVRGEQRVSDSRKAIQRYLKELRQQKADLIAREFEQGALA